jgi:hypothetical protein
MRGCVSMILITVALAAIGSSAFGDEPKDSAEVQGRVLILKEATKEPVGTVNSGGLIVVEITDSGSRPPQDMRVEGGKCVPLGHVRGVATNKEGKPMMGGGYTWYLFKVPADAGGVEIDVSYLPNGQSTPKPAKRRYQVKVEK